MRIPQSPGSSEPSSASGDIPWQSWVVLRQLRRQSHLRDHDPREVQVTLLALHLKMSKRNVIIGLTWLTEANLLVDHGRTEFGARVLSIAPNVCLCGGLH
jgi:hypothetical protein